jgi:hypothetical protein
MKFENLNIEHNNYDFPVWLHPKFRVGNLFVLKTNPKCSVFSPATRSDDTLIPYRITDIKFGEYHKRYRELTQDITLNAISLVPVNFTTMERSDNGDGEFYDQLHSQRIAITLSFTRYTSAKADPDNAKFNTQITRSIDFITLIDLNKMLVQRLPNLPFISWL